MAIQGQAVLAIWNGIQQDAETEFLNWHVHEHIPERVALPGFRRGRRYVALDGHPKFFNFYEADRPEDFTSDAYHAALNTPSPWTKAVVRHFTDTSRTVCRVLASWGCGEGALVEAVRLSGGEATDAFLHRLADSVLPEIAARPGVVGAHLLKGQGEMGRQNTEETRLRGGPDAVADVIVLVELTDAAILSTLRASGPLCDDSLRAVGAEGEIRRGVYALQYSLSKDELPHLLQASAGQGNRKSMT